MLLGRSLDVPSGTDIMEIADRSVKYYGLLSIGVLFAMFVGCVCAKISGLRMMAKWRVGYLKAVLRQDSAWYDVNKGQELAGTMGAAMNKLERALSLQTYIALIPLGNVLSASLVHAPTLQPRSHAPTPPLPPSPPALRTAHGRYTDGTRANAQHGLKHRPLPCFPRPRLCRWWSSSIQSSRRSSLARHSSSACPRASISATSQSRIRP